jgi:hypothetical protein
VIVSVSPLISIVTEIVTIPGRLVTPKTAALLPHRCRAAKGRYSTGSMIAIICLGHARISITLGPAL